MLPPVRVIALISSVCFIVILVQLPTIEAYVASVKKHDVVPVFGYSTEQRIVRQIRKEAPKHYIEPINARVDRIWKAIPGLNGREVNLNETIRRTLEQKDRKSIQWVYREIPPKIQLKDLGNEPVYRGNEKKPAAALMVNVAWGTEYIPQILKILKKEQIKATFFLDGSWLKKNPEAARQIIREGHEIGNHAYSHPLMSQISTAQMEKEIGKTQALIEKHLQVKSKWFAPPAGDFDRRVIKMAAQFHMNTILWTLDTVDWKKSVSPEMMVGKVEKEIVPGTLLLTHPTDRTVKALPQIIRAGKNKGLKWMTVSNLLSSKRVK
ncbi:polysaccharide deacetylase family protein [Thermoactinomyces mirandus]|uniref:Polysaccharide deacetylase family protein n=1 Tax=Thermoactinomyces mirandus TaxID=2756294 RepID=A0A7W1XRS8_9BACL|nr:polysaccharide deacetylase family protein [Thermoactinomyces mirandus]MBA4602094.1 polysaccharide deacetylase family protein [Thermoactinomyces mirandus]